MAEKATTTTPSAAAPGLCKSWSNFSSSLPTIRLFGLDVSLTIASFMFLAVMRLIYMNCLIHIFNWPSDSLITMNATSSCTSITHSLTLLPGLYACLTYKAKYEPSARMSTSLPYYKQAVTGLLQFCTGYMIYDGLLNIIYLKWRNWDSADYQFLGHHIATSVYMTATRYYQAGHESALMCMFLGEMTNPFHNGYYIADFGLQLSCCNGQKMQMFHDIVQLLFAISYVIIRLLVAPVVLGYTCYDLIKNGHSKGGIHRPMIALWVLLIVGVMAGSIPWALDCWKMIMAYFPNTDITPGEVAKEL